MNMTVAHNKTGNQIFIIFCTNFKLQPIRMRLKIFDLFKATGYELRATSCILVGVG
jgi:hypothetical protein